MKADQAYLSTLWHNICLENDQRSFEELFHLCYKRLVRFAAEYIQNRESAEEIVADIFLKLWAGRQSFADVVHVEKYLFTAVRNQSLNYLRQFSGYRVVSTDKLSIINSFDPSQATEWRELLARLDEAVESLPSQRRRIFRLIKEEGFKAREVAEIMNLSQRTVETQLFKALKQLHSSLSPYLSQIERKQDVKVPVPAMALIFLLIDLFR